MTVLTGHLTQGNKDAIRAILKQGLMAGKVGRTNYFLSRTDSVFTVRIVQQERHCIGAGLKPTTYIHTFRP